MRLIIEARLEGAQLGAPTASSSSSEADVTLAGTAWASLGVVTHPKHKIFHSLNERPSQRQIGRLHPTA
jgi:hypothetical protein